MPQVMTIKGPISSNDLGVTLCHTHVLCNLTCIFAPPEEASKIGLAEVPLRLDNLGAVHRDVLAVKDNLLLGDVDAAVWEVSRYRMMGGNSLVEVSMPGLGRDPVGLFKVSAATDLNIICATGWYIAISHPPLVAQSSRDELCAIMVEELTKGIGKTGIRAGVIKVAMGHNQAGRPFSGDEEKVLRAAARAQAITGAALTIHPARPYTGKHWHIYMDIVEQEGGRLEKCYLSHMEFFSQDIEYQRSVLDRGVTIAYDQFGNEMYMYSRGEGYPSDRQRVAGILALGKLGYAGQIVLSNEVAYKCSCVQYGGYGYAHVLENILPELRSQGMTEEQFHIMLVENPKRLLAF